MSSARIVYRKNENDRRNLNLIETKPGELDRRLESWLHSMDGIGYLTEPDKVIFHE